MKGEVKTALNIVGFDNKNFTIEVLKEILAGADNKVKECGGITVGGHTINADDLFFGLSVTGFANPNDFWQNHTAQIGDLLILTKPLGTGILSTALKQGLLSKNLENEINNLMSNLNYKAMKILSKYKVSACTDVTGFGLLGHAKEMQQKINFEFFWKDIPLLDEVENFINKGVFPGGARRNKNFLYHEGLSDNLAFYDPQTSGGLLVAIEENDALNAIKELRENGYEKSSIIGIVT